MLDALALQLQTPKDEIVKEIEAHVSEFLGIQVREAFRAVAEQQHHNAASPNLDRAHKSALVLVAHELGKQVNQREKVDQADNCIDCQSCTYKLNSRV